MARIAVLLLPLALIDLAEANKFETIGGGVSGVGRHKVAQLKDIAAWAGGFLMILGGLALLGRSRFEGFVGMYTGRRGESVIAVPLMLLVLGAILLGISLIG